MNERYVLAGAALLAMAAVLLTLGGAGAAPAAAQEYDLGDEHGLATNQSVETYDEEGVISDDVSGLDARLTLAEDHEDVGIDSYATDLNRHYLRVQYNESIERTLRFELPAGLFSPYPADDLESRDGDVTADLQPVENGSATAVTMTLDGETDAVFELSKAASMVFGVRGTTSGWIENVTGYSLPSLSSSDDDWTTIPDSAWQGTNSTPAIEKADEPLMVQYDASDTAGEARWISAPECGNAQDYEDVCRYTRDGSDTELLVARTNETPAVRYRHGRSLIDHGSAAINELVESIEGLFGALPGGIF